MRKQPVLTAATFNVWLALSLAAFLSFFPNEVKANTVALSISESNRGDDIGFDSNVGWRFTVITPILVTDLGVWDGFRRAGAAGGNSTPAGGGLGEAHTVTIWDANGNALTQATVPAGTVGTLVGVFRYVPVASPLLLQPGTYTIGAYYAGDTATPDSSAFFADPIVTAPELTYDNSMYWYGPGAPDPFSPSEESGYFGPNFQFQTAADNTPPSIDSVTASPDVLRPANHRLIPVTVSVSATDDSGQVASCKIVDVTANNPVSKKDIVITGDLTVKLRAERSGPGKGPRVYTITVRCTDASGNFSDSSVQVIVPFDKGK